MLIKLSNMRMRLKERFDGDVLCEREGKVSGECARPHLLPRLAPGFRVDHGGCTADPQVKMLRVACFELCRSDVMSITS